MSPSAPLRTVAEALAALPTTATPAERRAALEQLARERNLSPFTSPEEWWALFGLRNAEDDEEFERFHVAIARRKGEDRELDRSRS